MDRDYNSTDFRNKWIEAIDSFLEKNYWHPMHLAVKNGIVDIKQITGFLLNPESITFSIGKTHIAMEYFGNEQINKLEDQFIPEYRIDTYLDESDDYNFFEKVIGIKYESSTGIQMPIPEFMENLISPTSEAIKIMANLGWNFAAQSHILPLNCKFFIPEGQFTRIINGSFFESKESALVTRRVKWIDFIPYKKISNKKEGMDSFELDLSNYINILENDIHYQYPLPEDFKYEKLQQVNKFVETFGILNPGETSITRFLSQDENKFIVMNSFFAKEIYPECVCKWQSEHGRDDIKPDFFVVKPNGMADIVEFKLPYLKGQSVVGKENREKFSAEIDSYIAQTRVYKEYFEDPNNRKWIEENYGFKAYRPKRTLVIGRRFDFDNDTWFKIKSDYDGLDIITYDDLVDGVTSQFYR